MRWERVKREKKEFKDVLDRLEGKIEDAFDPIGDVKLKMDIESGKVQPETAQKRIRKRDGVAGKKFAAKHPYCMPRLGGFSGHFTGAETKAKWLWLERGKRGRDPPSKYPMGVEYATGESQKAMHHGNVFVGAWPKKCDNLNGPNGSALFYPKYRRGDFTFKKQWGEALGGVRKFDEIE